MPQQMELLRRAAARALTTTENLTDDLTDDPDCLAELEFTYSVFRFRYKWGTVYELSFTNLSDAHDRDVCCALLPIEAIYLDTVESNTMGLGFNGINREVTHRMVTADT